MHFNDHIFANEVDVNADIEISFLPCHHESRTNLNNDLDFENCEATFAHALYPQYGELCTYLTSDPNEANLYFTLYHNIKSMIKIKYEIVFVPLKLNF